VEVDACIVSWVDMLQLVGQLALVVVLVALVVAVRKLRTVLRGS
jgi:hypothetical protein